jgi:hypothetical protein
VQRLARNTHAPYSACTAHVLPKPVLPPISSGESLKLSVSSPRPWQSKRDLCYFANAERGGKQWHRGYDDLDGSGYSWPWRVYRGSSKPVGALQVARMIPAERGGQAGPVRLVVTVGQAPLPGKELGWVEAIRAVSVER